MSINEHNTTLPSGSQAGALSPQTVKPQRVLACVLCSQRKVKCDRKFPCANCVRSHAQCVPSSPPARRQRRRRFPERELLNRLRHYESLLRQNNVKFEPLHQDAFAANKKSPNIRGERRSSDSQDDAGGDQSPSSSVAAKSESVYDAKNYYRAMMQRGQSRNSDEDSRESSPEDLPETVVKAAWSEMYKNNDHLLFGSREEPVDVSTLHPAQVQIFRLWQIYIDNVNPLLKITHVPTMQSRVIDAASNLASIKPAMASLMFGIYCMAILSLGEDDCLTIFDSPREILLTKYQFGCQQALLSCGFLRSADRDCLTALYLYLISVRPATIPSSLSSLLGIVTRVAQRIGLHSESANAKYPALEAEMRRRLWWSLVLFDNRICEMSEYKSSTLTPTWDCAIPLNVNDHDLQPEMKDPPPSQEKTSDALFAVVRSEMAEIVRHAAFHLDYVNPALKAVVKNSRDNHNADGTELIAMEKVIESNYLRYCNPGIPLHFMTIWTARYYLAKCHLLEHYSKFPRLSTQQSDAQRDIAISYAISMLDCDTKLMASPLTKGYLWFLHLYFPFPAYAHIIHDLRMRPVSDHVEKAWKVMSENYEARFKFVGQHDTPLFDVFTKIVLEAWEACEAVHRNSGNSLVPPRIVLEMQQKVTQPTQAADDAVMMQPDDIFSMSANFSMPMPENFDSHGPLGNIGEQGYTGPEPGQYPNVFGQAPLNNLNWPTMDWNPFYGYRW